MSDYDFVQAKDEYRKFCDTENHDIQIFALPWYLDAVCKDPNDWRVIVYKENNRIVAAFPFEYTRRKKLFWRIANPFQAPRLGIWMNYGNRTSPQARESFENKVTRFVIQNLPSYDIFSIACDARYTNWREFYNHGFKQETRYSYLLKKTKVDPNIFLSQILSKKRNKINNLLGKIPIVKSVTFSEYWNFFYSSYQLRERMPSYSENQLQRLFNAAMARGQGEVRATKNSSNQINAVLFILFDNRRSYEMFCSHDPNSGFSSREFLTYDAAFDSLKLGRDYDFEGSMIPGVATYNREFNGEMEPYFLITNYSPRMKFIMNFLENFTILKKIFSFNKKGIDD